MDVVSPSLTAQLIALKLYSFLLQIQKIKLKTERERKNMLSKRRGREETCRTLCMSQISATLDERDDGKETTTIISSFLQLSLSPNNTHSQCVFNVYSNNISFTN